MSRFMARGPAIFRAPENDEGADYEEGQGGESPEDDAEEDGEGDEAGDDEEVPDQGEDDDVGEDEGQEDRPAQVAGKSRGANRVAEATRIAAEAKTKADNLERELVTLRAERAQTQRQESATQRAERLAMMDPEQKTEYLLNEQAQNFQGQLNVIRFESQDSADRTAFTGLCARSPVAQKYAAEVESELQRLRGLGNNYAREVVLKYIIGEKALSAQPRAQAKQQRSADANRDRQRARPSGGRSDVPADNGRGGTEAQRRAKRLADMQI